MYQYLKPETLVTTFNASKKYTEGLTDNFREYERLARNKPHGSIPKEYPKTTDGTLASIIRKTPHRIIQQLPVGSVKSDTDDWLSVIASFIYTHQIIPNANESYALLQKCWNVVERFLAFGSCPTYAPFTSHNGYYCTDLRLPYWGDIFVQPGKLSDADSNYIFLRSWWQKADIEALIEAQTALGKKATWDVVALGKVKDLVSTKDEKSKTPADRGNKSDTGIGIELITGFQRGVGAKFYTFHMQSTGQGKYTGTVVRTKINKDPRGELPVSFAYGDIDGSNPLGRSVIDLAGPLQNLMDGEMQMYQYNRALQLNPPLIKRGNFSKSKIKFTPNAIIDVGSNPDSNVEPLQIDTTALANFPNNYGLMKSQMLNLLASPDTSISSDVGNPGFSKTPQGVEASRANLSVDDNYVRKQFETWFERWSETAINLYFAERSGVEELQLDDEAADMLRQLPDFAPGVQQPDGSTSPAGPMAGMLSDDNKVRIDYSSATPALKFRVVADSSKSENDPAQQAIAVGLLDTVMKFPMLNRNFGGAIDVDELAHAIVDTSGIDNKELIAPEPTRTEKAEKEASRQQPNGFSPLFDKPQIRIDYKDVEDPGSRAGLLKLAGAPPEQELPPIAPGIAEQAARQSGAPEDPAAETQEDPNAVTPDHILKAHAQAHSQALDEAKLALEAKKVGIQQQQADTQKKVAMKPAPKPAAKPAAKPAKKGK